MDIFDECRTVNRIAVTFTPRKPFFDWAKYVAPEVDTASMEALWDHNTFLINSGDLAPDIYETLKTGAYLPYFEYHLEEYYLDEAAWPADRSWEVFIEWFDIHISTVVYDTLPSAIRKK